MWMKWCLFILLNIVPGLQFSYRTHFICITNPTLFSFQSLFFRYRNSDIGSFLPPFLSFCFRQTSCWMYSCFIPSQTIGPSCSVCSPLTNSRGSLGSEALAFPSPSLGQPDIEPGPIHTRNLWALLRATSFPQIVQLHSSQRWLNSQENSGNHIFPYFLSPPSYLLFIT